MADIPQPASLNPQLGLTGNGDQRQTLVVVFLRGGADGLNLVAPLDDDGYYRARPRIAIGRKNAVPLDGFYGLNPLLKGAGTGLPGRRAGDHSRRRLGGRHALPFRGAGFDGARRHHGRWLAGTISPRAKPGRQRPARRRRAGQVHSRMSARLARRDRLAVAR